MYNIYNVCMCAYIYIYIYMMNCNQTKLSVPIYTGYGSLVQVHFLCDAITEFKRFYKICYEIEN